MIERVWGIQLCGDGDGMMWGHVWVVCMYCRCNWYWEAGRQVWKRRQWDITGYFKKLIIPPCVCRKLIPNTTGKSIFLVTTSCTWNVLSSIAMDSEFIPSAITGLSSAPETENCIGCSSWTKDNKQYNCSSKRLIEEPVSIDIVIGLWSKVPDTSHWQLYPAQ